MNPFMRPPLPHLAIITRNPTAAETGITQVATNVPCSTIYPADRRKWDVDLATEFTWHEAFLETAAAVQTEDVLAVNGRSLTIKKVNRWTDTRLEVLLEEKA